MDKLENKVVLHEYFFLDLALLLIDSIDQVAFHKPRTHSSSSRSSLLVLLELSAVCLKALAGRPVLVGAAAVLKRFPRSWRRRGLNMEGLPQASNQGWMQLISVLYRRLRPRRNSHLKFTPLSQSLSLPNIYHAKEMSRNWGILAPQITTEKIP